MQHTVSQLLACNREMSRVFGACITVQNTAHGLRRTTRDMELLARNGVARAARIDGDDGRPLLALADILSGLPGQIGPEVDELESLCDTLARHTADCSHDVRIYTQLVSGLDDELTDPMAM